MDLETYDRRDENNKSRNKKILFFLILFLIIFFLIFFIVRLAGCSDRSGDSESAEVDFEELEVDKEEGESIELVEETCFTKKHNFNLNSIGWANLEEPYISPLYTLGNSEDIEGIFRIRYTFFDESVYPYVQFGNSNFTELSEYASMHSEWKAFNLEPNEEVLVSIPTLKPEVSKNYWTVPDIEAPPEYEVCSTN